MKKFFIAAAILLITSVSQAQTTKDNTAEKHHRATYSHKNGGMQKLNLSDAQKKQFKELHESYHKQITDLRANKSLTADDLKNKSQALRKEQHEKMQSLLTPEQKTQMAAQKKEGGKDGKEGKKHGRNFEQMKTSLGLTDDQAAKLKTSQEGFHSKVKAIRSDNTLTDSQKKEQVKALGKQQKENMKALLTPEQLEKMKAGRKNKTGSK